MNIVSSFRDLKSESDFIDISLCTNDKRKKIKTFLNLNAASVFFTSPLFVSESIKDQSTFIRCFKNTFLVDSNLNAIV